MPEVDTIPESLTQWPEPPRLLVEWSSRWEEFKSALHPALARPPRRLAGEAPVGMFPYRGMLVCWLLECLLLIAIIVLPERFASLEIPLPPTRPQWDVIYYSGDELPQTQDRGGAQSGKSGRAGGQQAHHRTQTIRVARGDKPRERVVDAPKLNLPHSDSAVANLLAFKPNPGPPPAEGLRSTLTAPDSAGDERGAAFAGTKFIRKPKVEHADPQHHSTRAECLARQDAHCKPDRAYRYRAGSPRRAA